MAIACKQVKLRNHHSLLLKASKASAQVGHEPFFVQGLDYLHYNKALHGDLKPANLLLSSERLVKIADFGSAMIYQESEGTWEGPVNGTPAFRPPETLTASGRLTRKVPSI